MKLIRKNTIWFRRSNGRRGSVIVLVVAVLALLAVIGTVYIVSARSEKVSAQAGSVAVNMDLAQQAVNDVAVNAIGEAMFDAYGVVGGAKGGVGGPFGGFAGVLGGAARTHDMAEFNPNLSDRKAGIRDESWLVTNLYRPGYETGVIGATWFNDMTMPQTWVTNSATTISPAVFDPSTGGYSIPVYPNISSYPYPVVGMFQVVPDPSVGMPTILLPNGNTGQALPDAIVQLLPFSDASGVRYRFGIRIIDTNRMANLNVGMTYPWAAITPNGTEYNGTFANGYNLASPSIFDGVNTPFYSTADEMEAIGGSNGPPPSALPPKRNPVRAGGLTANGDPLVWSEAILRLDVPQLVSLAPFDLSDELGLRSYGTLGTMSVPRFAGQGLWSNNLGNRPVGSAKSPQYNWHRGEYTSYSYSRELRAGSELDPIDPITLNSTAFVLQDDTGNPVGSFPGGVNVWPAYPARIGVGVDVSTSAGMTQGDAANILAATVTNIATAMNRMPTVVSPRYSRDEAVAFAANYLTYRWADWTQSSCLVGGTDIKPWRLINGPSFIDSQGICVRNQTVMQNYGTLTTADRDLDSGVPNQTVLGYAAQPFINEIVIRETTTATGTTPDDFAVELYNPYNVSLSLDGYKLMVDGASYDLSITTKKTCIPARGYFVFAKNGGSLATSVNESATLITNSTEYTGTAKKDDDSSYSIAINSQKIYLLRSYVRRDNTVGYGAVDQIDISGFGTFVYPLGTNTYNICRPNEDTNVNDPYLLTRWKATVGLASASAPSLGTGSLGSANPNGATNGIPLYSRDATFASRMPFINIADFNNIMRIAHQIDGTTGLPTNKNTIPAQLTTIVGAANPEGSVHFDFDTDPAAKQMLGSLAMVDRVSDYTINLGDNDPTNRGVSKLRIPGQINVNTAPPEVLATIPFLNANPQYISKILAYRWRTVNDHNIDNRFTPGLRQADGIPAFDYRPGVGPTGYGISSMLELKTLLNPATSTTLADRDQNWARVYNYLTLRSDTFVVYAYLEAVRLNPRYSGSFTNGLEWYTNNYTQSNVPIIGVSDNPNDTTHALQIMGRRRWVAIVDRSYANYSRYVPELINLTPPQNVRDQRFTLPRVVAQKDLPR
jgi:hypothetical protein